MGLTEQEKLWITIIENSHRVFCPCTTPIQHLLGILDRQTCDTAEDAAPAITDAELQEVVVTFDLGGTTDIATGCKGDEG